ATKMTRMWISRSRSPSVVSRHAMNCLQRASLSPRRRKWRPPRRTLRLWVSQPLRHSTRTRWAATMAGITNLATTMATATVAATAVDP
ncbi:hypothetical protein BGZ70_006199, partial [Mortierella alpina]